MPTVSQIIILLITPQVKMLPTSIRLSFYFSAVLFTLSGLGIYGYGGSIQLHVAAAQDGNSNSINMTDSTVPTIRISSANLGPFDAKLQYYPPNPTQTADFRPIIINPEPDFDQTCKPYLDRFVMNSPRVSLSNAPRFLIQAQCVTIVGTVSWTHYFNEDGDANFNIVPDPQYRKYMSAGNFAPYFIGKYTTPAIHMEVVCQGTVGEIGKKLKDHACDEYNGPDFNTDLPQVGDKVQVTGRWLLDNQAGIKEGGGIAGHSELHPVYDIKIIDKGSGSTSDDSSSTPDNNPASDSSSATVDRDSSGAGNSNSIGDEDS
jgi:hypothetical protein